MLFMPLLATNLFLPFYMMDLKSVETKMEIIFFFLVPFASVLWIFVDGLPGTISYFGDKWKELK